MTQANLPRHLSLITDLFSSTRHRKEFVSSIVDKLKIWPDCECVGIRIVNQNDYMPYDAYVGFSQEFWEHENWLSLKDHQCGCIRIVKGTPIAADQPILTENCSIWSNNLQEFGRSLPVDQLPMYRGRCIESGFNSLALVPIRNTSGVLGLIHLADNRIDMLPYETIRTLEALAVPMAEVIDRISTEDQLQQKKADIEHFVYTVAHDLKSPIITIESFLRVLSKDINNENWNSIDKDFKYILGATDTIKQLVDALLQLSRVGHIERRNETVSLGSIIEETMTTLAGAIADK